MFDDPIDAKMTRTEVIALAVYWAIIVCMGLAIWTVWFWPLPAKAQDGYGHCAGEYCWDWGLGTGDPHKRWHRSYTSHYYVRDYYRTPPAAEFPDRQQTLGRHCLEPVRGVGSQFIGQVGALEAAKKDWMERVRYDHGEKFLDLANARDFDSRCGRTSIGEVAGQVLFRCEVWARPCKAELEENEEALARDKKRAERQEELLERHEDREERR